MFPYIELNSKSIYFASSVLWAQTSLDPPLGENHWGDGDYTLKPLYPSEIPAVLLSLGFLSQKLLVVQALVFMLSVKGTKRKLGMSG